MSEPLVIGLTGSFGSGCTTIAEYLEQEHGFYRYRLSSPITSEAKKDGLDRQDRLKLQDIGNRLRQAHGNGYLGELAIEHVSDITAEKIVLDGIRNPAEEYRLRRKFANFHLVSIAAGRDIRYERVKNTMKQNEDLFDDADSRDKGEPEDWGQQVRLCVDVADIVVQNNEQLDLKSPIGKKKLFEPVAQSTHQ